MERRGDRDGGSSSAAAAAGVRYRLVNNSRHLLPLRMESVFLL